MRDPQRAQLHPARAALPDGAAIERAAAIVRRHVPPTPQYAWPLLGEALDAEVWIKHENHTPTGAFKLRGGLVYFDELDHDAAANGVVSATRGNHGQSIGFAARLAGIAATVVVPRGNSREKNAAMRALGVTLVEHGDDFQAAREHAVELAASAGLHMIPAFHDALVRGVATYWIELFAACPYLDVVYAPIGMGSGICAAIAARAAMAHKTKIVGVVSAHAPAYRMSVDAKRVIEAPATTRLADGMACRAPDAAALAIIVEHVDRIVEVSDAEVAAAMRLTFTATHQVAEGAGAAPLAAAWRDRVQLAGKKVGLPISGGNVDRDVFAAVLDGSWQ